jgi:hypothetical protein
MQGCACGRVGGCFVYVSGRYVFVCLCAQRLFRLDCVVTLSIPPCLFQVESMDSTLFVLHSNDMAKPPVMRIRVTNDTQRAEAEDGESESYNEEELAALKQLEFHLLNQV